MKWLLTITSLGDHACMGKTIRFSVLYEGFSNSEDLWAARHGLIAQSFEHPSKHLLTVTGFKRENLVQFSFVTYI